MTDGHTPGPEQNFTLQELRQKRYIVLSGGGIHGVSHLGFVSYIKHVLGGNEAFGAQFLGFAGVSIGAFLSLLLACGEFNLARLFYWMTNPTFFLRLLQQIDMQRAWRSYGAVPPDVVSRICAPFWRHTFPDRVTGPFTSSTPKPVKPCPSQHSTPRAGAWSTTRTKRRPTTKSPIPSMHPCVCPLFANPL